MFILYANKNILTVRKYEPLTSGSVNVCRARFEFSPDWDGLKRKAVFTGSGAQISVLLDESGECDVPWEALAKHGGQLTAGVFGTADDTVLPTVQADLGTILEGVSIDGDDRSEPPTPEIWEQELANKGERLEFDGQNLSLIAAGRRESLSTVQIVGGEGKTAGIPGNDGVSPTVSARTAPDNNGTVVTITDVNGEHSFTILNGKDGEQGLPGEKGEQGPAGPKGDTGTAGKDAAINGMNTLTIEAGNGITLEQQDSVLRIGANVSGPNLINNWYFLDPVNQRNKTEYTVIGQYTIDRWILTGNSGEVELTEAGLRLNKSAVEQRFEKGTLLSNREYTLSILTSDGNLHSITHTVGLYTTILSFGENMYARMHNNLELYDGIVIWGSDGQMLDLTIAAVKLELGSVQTLAHKEGDKWVLSDPPPDKALELAKCQRYQIPFPAYAAFPITWIGPDEVNAIISTPVQMRANPTLVDVTLAVRDNEINGAHTDFVLNAVAARPQCLCINMTKENHGIHSACLYSRTHGMIDANL